MNKLKISLITVCFNSAETLVDTLRSVQSQSYDNIEYIVIDGGSTDNTGAIIEQYAATIDCYISEPDNGIYDAMNKGIHKASGDIIGFINADDILAHAQVLEKIAETFKHQEIDACYADLEYVSASDFTQVVRFWQSSPFAPGAFSRGWSPPHPTFYVKKAIYEQYGGFDLRYKMGNDIELMLRFLEKYHIKSVYVPETWVKMRMGGVSNQSIGNIILQNKEIIKAAKDNGIPFFMPMFIFGKVKDRLLQYLFN